jgi:hypothetical protein
VPPRSQTAGAGCWAGLVRSRKVDELIAAVRSAALVIQGEPGIGKTSLLRYGVRVAHPPAARTGGRSAWSSHRRARAFGPTLTVPTASSRVACVLRFAAGRSPGPPVQRSKAKREPVRQRCHDGSPRIQELHHRCPAPSNVDREGPWL